MWNVFLLPISIIRLFLCSDYFASLATRMEGGLILAGPPCSYFVFMSSSIHQRATLGPRGNELHQGVRLANLITENLVSR